jgi:hypothetical protein
MAHHSAKRSNGIHGTLHPRFVFRGVVAGSGVGLPEGLQWPPALAIHPQLQQQSHQWCHGSYDDDDGLHKTGYMHEDTHTIVTG